MERRTKAEWAALVAEYRQSGKTMKSFCGERGINVKTFGNHAHKRQIMEGLPKGPYRKETGGRSSEEWLALITEQKASGKKRSAWCREHGIRPDAMTKAERRLKADSRQFTPKPAEWLELSPQSDTETQPMENENANSAVKIRMGDIEIEISASYPTEKLATLMRALVKSC